MSEAQPGGPPECACERLRGEMRLSWRDCAGSPLAAVLGCGGCEQIIPSSAERSKHQTHGGEWITPTGRDSGTLPGGVWVEGLGVCGPDKRPWNRSKATGEDKTVVEVETSIEVVSRKKEMMI